MVLIVDFNIDWRTNLRNVEHNTQSKKLRDLLAVSWNLLASS